MVGDAAANARPHMGFGVAKAGGDAQALANALRDHDDIDTALKAYNAERQPIGNTIVMHSRKLGTHMGVNLKTEEDRRMHELLAGRRRDDGLDRGAEFPGRLQVSVAQMSLHDERASETRFRAQHADRRPFRPGRTARRRAGDGASRPRLYRPHVLEGIFHRRRSRSEEPEARELSRRATRHLEYPSADARRSAAGDPRQGHVRRRRIRRREGLLQGPARQGGRHGRGQARTQGRTRLVGGARGL